MINKAKTTCALILDDKNNVLLIKRGRDPYNGCWALVSGVFESRKGLPPNDAIKKEIEWDLGTSSFTGSQIFSMPILQDAITDEIIVYAGHINVEDIKLKPEFSEEIRWVPLTEASQESLAFEHAKIIEEYLSLN